jgi:hypothetical protein
MDRRQFLAISTAALGHRLYAANRIDVRAIDRKRVLKAAERYLTEKPVTITGSQSPRSAGGSHDYFSEGDYWWPDPAHPDGPYIQRDGMSNPENFNAHREALIRLSVQVPALTAAWLLTKQRRFADHAVSHLRAWFINDATKMNPNLQYAQAIHGITPGRGIGVIDTLHLVEVARAVGWLEAGGTFGSEDNAALHSWFATYLTWMTTSKNGTDERDAKNNHGTCWVEQAAEFARYTGNDKITDYCRERFKTVLIKQIAPDGSFPEELRRTKPYGYSLFNLDAMATVCRILSTAGDNLFVFESPAGGSMKKAMAYMFPFIADKGKWPHSKDVMYWNGWPVRHPSLLFAGLALGNDDYLSLWRTLNPDPSVGEIIRNFPIRQPALWV